jgi:DNA (cytosine-5)-methyltransferase 3A
MNSGLNVLSLFDGMSCGRVALERAGIKVANYYASEIDKYATTVSQKNYPDIIRLGDVTKIKGADLPNIHLLIGGSPCQGFSFAGKQLNFEDPRSKLFFEFVRLLHETKPAYFLLENVVMKKEYQDVISEYLGVKPILINSATVSAQNRKRLYWANFPITQPEDRGLVLRDILEERVDAKFFVGSRTYDYFLRNTAAQKEKGNGFAFSVVDESDKSKTIRDPSKSRMDENYIATTREGELNKATIVGRRINDDGHRDDYNKEVKLTQTLEVRATGTDKSNCLTTVDKDNVLTSLPPGRYPDAYNLDAPIRRLTPIECERLQTLPDNYTEGVSDSQRYKMLGNGWTVDVIAHIFKNMINDELC